MKSCKLSAVERSKIVLAVSERYPNADIDRMLEVVDEEDLKHFQDSHVFLMYMCAPDDTPNAIKQMVRLEYIKALDYLAQMVVNATNLLSPTAEINFMASQIEWIIPITDDHVDEAMQINGFIDRRIMLLNRELAGTDLEEVVSYLLQMSHNLDQRIVEIKSGAK